MKIIDQSWQWEQRPPIDALQILEKAGRTCYKSEDRITSNSDERFISFLIKRGHLSVIEHVSASVRFITDRGVTHELVRHRLAAFSQESTRYCNYGGSDIVFIRPVWLANDDASDRWVTAMEEAEYYYNELLARRWTPEKARSVLPNSLKTEIIMTCNLREWMHVFTLRTSPAAHPQMRKLMESCLEGFKDFIPVIFDHIGDNT